MCEVCGRGGDFEILTDGSDIQEDSKIGEHVKLINTFLVYSLSCSVVCEVFVVANEASKVLSF